MVIMFNLLISIINETATVVRHFSLEYQFQERSEAIASVQRIVPYWAINYGVEEKESGRGSQKLLLICHEIIENEEKIKKVNSLENDAENEHLNKKFDELAQKV